MIIAILATATTGMIFMMNKIMSNFVVLKYFFSDNFDK